MRLENRQRMMAIAAGACLLLLLGDRLVFSPALAAFRERSERLSQLRAEVSRADFLLDRADVWQAQLRTFQDNALPADPSQAEGLLLATVRKWASEAGLTIVSMRPRWQEDGDSETPILELRVAGTGDLAAVSGFLFAVETCRAPLKAASVSVASANDSPARLSISVELHGTLWRGSGLGTEGGDA